MSLKKIQLIFICAIIFVVSVTPGARVLSIQPDQSARSEINSDQQVDSRLLKIARATGREQDQLELLVDEPVVLLNGKRLEKFKALDLMTGEIVGATFYEDRQVDEQAERLAAGNEWRALHGAQTPQLMHHLTELAPDDVLDISVWLKADIQPLPRPDELVVFSEAGRGTSSSEDAPTTGLALTDQQEKIPALPIPLDQVPDEILDKLHAATSGDLKITPEDAKPADVQPAISVPDRTNELDAAEAFKQQNDVFIKAQITPVRAHFLDLMKARGINVAYASDTVPSAVILGITREQVESLAFLTEIDAIYAVPKDAGPSISNARPTQNMTFVNNAGYTGTGVKVAVTEGERGFAANPYLEWSGYYNSGAEYKAHPTAVGGIIKSTASGYLGLANGVQLYSANGSYSDWATMTAAMDWGKETATVLNNSWYWDYANSPVFWEADRRQDYYMRYNYDFVVVAAGNFGNGCGGNFTSYVVSPAKGYNVMSVGNHEDNDNLGWTGDTMNTCSSFGNPGADSASTTHEKPEVSAVGSTIKSTLISTSTNVSQAIGNVGSGTSYAAPMVAALAANIIQAEPTFSYQPERLKSIIMATALHNIEGNARLSDVDGTGGIVGSAALATVERGNSADLNITSSTEFPLWYTQYVYKGERVRFVINWLSNPNATYTTDVLPVDLDLTAYRNDGTTVVAYSTSASNSFEIVDFIAPASETYRFRVSKFGTYTGSGTWLGLAWWRGTYRISPDTAYSDPKATPLGTHLTVYPTDWTPTNYWRAMGIRSNSSDHDLGLASRTIFDDPGLRTSLSGSTSTSPVDFIVVDGNHWPKENQEQYIVNRFSGDGGYYVNWSNQGKLLLPGFYGPFTMGSSTVLKVYDILFLAYQPLKISVIPGGSNAADLGVRLFKSDPGTSSTWYRSKSQAVRIADASTLTGATERLTYFHTGNTYDYLGLVVYSNSNASAQYYILVEDLRVFVPFVRR